MAQADIVERTKPNFDPPQPADDSDITDEGVIIRLRSNRIVGLTILNAAKTLVSSQFSIQISISTLPSLRP